MRKGDAVGREGNITSPLYACVEMSLWNTVPCTMKSGQKKSNVSHRTWGV